MIYLLIGTFFEGGSFTLSNFATAFEGERTLEMVANSLWYAVGSTVLAMVTGTALAFVNARTDAPFKGLVVAFAVVPIIMPAVLYAPAWIFLASPEIGLMNDLSRALFGGAIFDIYGMWGMIWVEGLHLSPIAFLLMMTAFRSMDPSLEEAGQVGGGRRSVVFRRITLPLTRPALTGATLLTLVLALESFEVPALIGMDAGIYVFTSQIYFLSGEYPPDLGAVGALSIALVGVVAVAVLLSRLASRGTASYQTITGKAFRPTPMELGKARPWVGAGLFIYFALTVLAPLGALAYASLLPYFRSLSVETLGLLTLDNYAALSESDLWWSALRNSFILALGSATVVMVLSVLVAWYVTRRTSRAKSLVEGLALAPLVIPGLVLGLGLMFMYLRVPLPIYGSLWILLIAYATRFIPFGMRYAVAAMQQMADELEESAYVSGATWGKAFTRIVLPLTSSGALGGWIFVVMVAFRELSTSILLYSPTTQVLAVLIFQQFNQGSLNVLAATGVVMVAVLVSIILIASKLGSRYGVQHQ